MSTEAQGEFSGAEETSSAEGMSRGAEGTSGRPIVTAAAYESCPVTRLLRGMGDK